VVFCPSPKDQATDRLNKYLLGLNIGRIQRINHELNRVELWWYWGTGWSDANWILWRAPKTKEAYKEWVSVDDLVCDEFNHIVRIEMENVAKRFGEKFKLSKESIKEINRCLESHKPVLESTPSDISDSADDSDDS